MKKIAAFALSGLLLGFSASGGPGLRLAVDPLRGSDDADGSAGAPLKTLEAARSKIRALKEGAGLPAGGVEVDLRGGAYRLRDASFTLDARDSGAPGRPVVWRAAPGARAVLTGAVRVDPSLFRPVEDPGVLGRLPEAARGRVLACGLAGIGLDGLPPVPKNGFGWSEKLPPPSVLVDGVRQKPARFPNSGFLTHSEIHDPGYVPRENPGHPEAFYLELHLGTDPMRTVY